MVARHRLGLDQTAELHHPISCGDGQRLLGPVAQRDRHPLHQNAEKKEARRAVVGEVVEIDGPTSIVTAVIQATIARRRIIFFLLHHHRFESR